MQQELQSCWIKSPIKDSELKAENAFRETQACNYRVPRLVPVGWETVTQYFCTHPEARSVSVPVSPGSPMFYSLTTKPETFCLPMINWRRSEEDKMNRVIDGQVTQARSEPRK